MKFNKLLFVLFTGSAAVFGQKYKDLCKKELALYDDCEIEIIGQSDASIIKGCGIFQSKRCQGFFEDPYRYAPSCYLAYKYDPPSEIKFIMSRKTAFYEVCSRIKNKSCTYEQYNGAGHDKYDYMFSCTERDSPIDIPIIEKPVKYELSDHPTTYEKNSRNCIKELAMYDECRFKFIDVDENEIINGCFTYESDKCKKFFDDPYSYAPSCKLFREDKIINVIKYKNIVVESQNRICSYIKEKYCSFSPYHLSGGGVTVYNSNIFLDQYDFVTSCTERREQPIVKPEPAKSKPTQSKPVEPKPTTNASRRCGPKFGACAKPGQCCSKHGYCGTTTAYCGAGCQSEFGVCSSTGKSKSKTTTTTTTTTRTIKKTTKTNKKIPTSTVSGRCGPKFGACAKSGQCCSKRGYCGTSKAYCGAGCQNGFGICSSIKKSEKKRIIPKKTAVAKAVKSSKKIPTSTVSGRCGPKFGACAKSGQCCSKHGYCGTSKAYCGVGCQSLYGKCY